MSQKIQCLMSPNEKKSTRATGLAKAISEDNRFELPDFKDINTDLQFIYRQYHLHQLEEEGTAIRDDKIIIFNCELKEPADYISSVLGPDGHAAMQYLDMAEAGHRCMFLVLGSDWEVSRAIENSLRGAGYKGSELAFQCQEYENRLRDFEAQAFGLYAPVFRWAIDKRKLDNEDLRWPDPYKRLLSHVHKVLTGASLAGYGPRAKDHERESFAANCLFRGIGPAVLEEVLKEYKVSLTPRHPNPKAIEEIKGVGKHRAELLNGRIVPVYGAMI